ncbi:hypothetical protein E1B28_008508 [Marasmius oreades]|uniref:Uncharacterized protein n=1 Tax=Marasmius oreades TaxID=181124 RepID=A0A9P7UUC8_9AGAR|nr:uncharacterized protein E1B28_008508 [Marasmius oreades]KAG7092134.1 hypothetical protein E1B28_008508 [Marasmius oreades]
MPLTSVSSLSFKGDSHSDDGVQWPEDDNKCLPLESTSGPESSDGFYESPSLTFDSVDDLKEKLILKDSVEQNDLENQQEESGSSEHELGDDHNSDSEDTNSDSESDSKMQVLFQEWLTSKAKADNQMKQRGKQKEFRSHKKAQK